MSKKLIAVASAAALALSALVAAPSVAAVGPFGVVTTGSISTANGTTGDLEFTINVPSQDVQRLDVVTTNASSTGTLLRHVVTTPLAGAAVSVAAAGGGAKLITQAQVDVITTLTSASGAATLSLTSDTGGNVTFYSFTTSTADSTITVSSAGASLVMYMKGISAKTNAYKMNFTVSPSSSAPAGELTFTGTITDAFGNLMKSVVATDIDTAGLGGDLTTITEDDFAQNATTSVITFTAVNRDTIGAAAFSIVLATAPTKITAFGNPVGSQFFNVNAVDLSAQVTALTAQVAALTADYNALAAKWNARVASKKAPKKAVATK
jgi:outer membrane murein-binding lipoprotein Lpp